MSDETFELELEAMAHGGSALGRHDKRTVFVPYTIPGERIRARLTQDKGRVAFGEGVTLLEASADRVFPVCPHFGPGKCWRCHWQHIDYPAQLLLKQDILADQLARIGGFEDADVREVIPSPEQWYYNYHMTMSVTEDGTPGFPTADDRIIPIQECHILNPDLLALYHALDLDFKDMRQLRLQIGTDGEHMLVLTMKSEDAPELEIDLPTSVNILLPDGEPVNLIGEAVTRYSIGGRVFRATAGSSIRANASQMENLVSVVLDMLNLTGNEAVLDLYAGVGIYSAFVGQRARLVTLVESYPPAVTDADENLSDLDNVDVIEGTVEEVVPALDDEYQVAIIDPPNDGLSAEAIDLLGEGDLSRLVYVSSDPATLARDAKRLAAKGYRLGAVQPIDLAPQTYYIDAIALLER
jgi:23S rRNA (uracil1939-C5)-methyltransferase